MDLDELDELDPVAVEDQSTQQREFGILIYGATGYSGCLMVEHLDALLSKQGAKPMAWAIAGRDVTKLRRIARRCNTAPAVLMVREPVQLAQAIGKARVIVNAAGPYTVCGEEVVSQCINQVTHYIDITGEVAWMHSMIAKYHERAKERGVMIVHSAGAISTPQELLSYALVRKLGPLKQYREYFFQYGATSGGTYQTGIAVSENLTPEGLAALHDPFALGGARALGDIREADEDCTKAETDPLFPSLWQMPAYNGQAGPRIVRRSCQLFEERPSDGVQYGKEISVTVRDCHKSQKVAEQEVQSKLPIPSVEVAAERVKGMTWMRDQGQAAKPGEGPPSATRGVYSAEVFGVAEAESGEWAHVHYTSGEAYEVTAMACISGALVLVEELDRVRPRERGGVVTPAFAFHDSTWSQRLTGDTFATAQDSCKIAFEVCDGKPKDEAMMQAVQDKLKKIAAGQSKIMKGELKALAQPSLAM